MTQALTKPTYLSIIRVMSNRPRIVVAESLSSSAIERLREAGEVVLLDKFDSATLQSVVKGADALVVRTYAQVSDEVIQQGAGSLKVIGRAGTGVDNIDVAAAQKSGIVVVHTPESATQAVAELTIGLIITMERRVWYGYQEVLAGRLMAARGRLAQREMHEMTLGIVGFGRIGQRVADLAHRAFGMKILYNDIREIRSNLVPAVSVSKEDLYSQSDVVSLHVPLTEQTRQLINRQSLERFKAGALLINTSRGAVVDAAALVEALQDSGTTMRGWEKENDPLLAQGALKDGPKVAGASGTHPPVMQSGWLSGAALDVTDPEPLPAGHPLLTAPNCIITPHLGSRTRLSQATMNDVVDDVVAVLQDRPPKYPYSDAPTP